MDQLFSVREIVNYLDTFFNVHNFPPDKPFCNYLPEFYSKAKVNYKEYILPDFLATYHGLMIESSKNIRKVLGTVFLSREILKKIQKRGDENFLIFSHHPMEDETCDRGFLPLPEEYHVLIKKLKGSVYSLHSPLDLHDEVSPTASIVKSLKLVDKQKVSLSSNEFICIVGNLPHQIKINAFVRLLGKIFENPEIHFIKNVDNVKRVCVLAGGGSYPFLIREILNLDCDTYITGDYISKLQNEYGDLERKEFQKISTNIHINFIECSHYATEKLVLKNEISQLFKSIGIPYEFIEQNEPWY